ncbi:MAG: molybdopterin dinucleotide binding domain-containing protein [Candidatus Longimicrobiales bacterium M2_2A_002]
MSKNGNNGGMERRDFLKVLGVAGAGAAATGCSSEPDRLIPYLVQPEQTVPGMATYYRTTCRECPAGCGMTVRTREGRAVKAEGTPDSPISHGKLCARGQASLHGLYDPDRVPQALVREGDSWSKVGWSRAEQSLAEALDAAGENAVFLTAPETGAMDRLLDEWCEAAGVRRVTFESFGHAALREASRRVYGRAALPIHDFANAEVVLSFGADFMETWLSPVDYSHGFVEGHAYANGHKGRFIAVSPHQSLTDLNADVWIAPRPGTEHLVALAMARLVADERGSEVADTLLADVDPAALAGAAGVELDRVEDAAHSFASRPSLAVGPGVGTSSAAATTLATAVAVLNEAAGNMGRTVRLGSELDGGATHEELAALVEEMAAGRVSALLVRGPNPLYELPDRDGVAGALDAVPFIASFSPFLDETSARAHLLLPDHHFLEAWGDHEPRPGVHSLVQPVMTPVYETKQTGDVLLSVARRAGLTLPSSASTYYDYLRERWREIHRQTGDGRAFDGWWTATLQKGTLVTDAYGQPGVPSARLEGDVLALSTAPAPLAGEGELSLVVYPSYRFYDGRTANRPWLQELPDPVSKHTWGTVLEMHPATAEEYGLDNGHIVELSTAQGTVELPVWRHPGVRPDTVAVQLGQGHEQMGRYARGRGINPVALLAARYDEAGGLAWTQSRADVNPTGRWERQPFSSEQDDVSGRHVYDYVSLEEAAAAASTVPRGAQAPVPAADAFGESLHESGALVGPGHVGGVAVPHGQTVHPNESARPLLQESGGFAPVMVDGAPQEYPPPGTHYGEYTEEQPRWAMAVDMERCIGCSACQTACQAENNIGLVGPELVAQGRLIQWIRIERYFEEEEAGVVHEMNGGAGHRKTTFLPMMCQQCGNAPCEPVCPVYASYHTPDGLNAQVYNRCVGTRYCANNCPYKVRYFNYFTYEWPEPLNWQLNPDVTVREKGIMEKCTFCVQRIRKAEHDARTDGRAVQDGEIVPACAQTCPGNAIVFGNIEDPGSRVARVVESSRGYRVFEELNTQSAVVYLKKVVEGGEGAAH